MKTSGLTMHLAASGLLVAVWLMAPAPGQAAESVANPLHSEGSWPLIQDDIAGSEPLRDDPEGAVLTLEAPLRAEDAATVPIQLIQQHDDAPPIRALRLVIDENPAPLVADITFGQALYPLNFETRVRVNQYSNIRAIATTHQGRYMMGRFVKASGGCSAPATRDAASARATMGQMRLREFAADPASPPGRGQAQIMIRHPNNSGLQRDQLTQLFVPALFLREIQVSLGDELLFSLNGGISISENPVFRFSFRDNGAEHFRVRAVDTDGNIFERQLKRGVSG